MPNRRPSWKEFREHAVYRVDNLFARGPGAQFLLLAILTVLVIALGMSAVWFGLFSPENQTVEGIPRDVDAGFFDSLLWAFAHVLDPSWFNADYGATLPILTISLAVSLMGLVIFGTFIGFMTAAVEGRLQALKEGNSRVKESGHVLILGWSTKVFFILRHLHDYNPKMKVVILSDRPIDTMREDLRVAVPPEVSKNTVLRNGTRTDLGELERMAFARAYAIIILADDDDALRGHADIAVIKTMMMLGEHTNWDRVTPKMVAELTRSENLEVARIAGKHRIPVFLSSDIISKVIVESVRQPGLSAVFNELFSFAGNEIYIMDLPQCAGRRFGSLSAHFPNAIPIGLSHARQENGRSHFVPELNPPSDRVVEPAAWVMVIAADRRIRFDARAPATPSRFRPAPRGIRPTLNRVLILGWNRNLYAVLRDFDAVLEPGSEVVVAAAYDADRAASLLEQNMGSKPTHIGLGYRQASYSSRPVLQGLLQESFDSIVLLADSSSHSADVDAPAIMTALLIRDLQQCEGLCAGARLVAEVTAIENRSLLELGNVTDVVAGTEIVSMMLTQMSQQQMLEKLYADLLDPRGNEIYLKPVQRYVPCRTPLLFADVQDAARQLGEVALGLMTAANHGRAHRFDVHLNPDRNRTWLLGEGDKVVVLSDDVDN